MSPEMDMALARRSGRLGTRQLPTAELLQDGVNAVLQLHSITANMGHEENASENNVVKIPVASMDIGDGWMSPYHCARYARLLVPGWSC